MSRRVKNTAPQTRKKRPAARHAPPRPRPRNLRPTTKRAACPLMVRLFSPLALTELPIALADDAVYPPCPKRHFRSWYRPRSLQAIRRYWAARKAQPAQSAAAHFEAAFYLFDFSPLRPRLAHLTLTANAQGEAPFDPLSLLLATWIKIALRLPWTALADLLAHPAHGARWRRLCGFRDGDTPAVATLRIFRDRLAPKQEAPAPPQEEFNAFRRLFLVNLDRLGLLPDPAATHGYTLAGDGQRHRARSRHRCHHAGAACFQEHTREQPRHCPAKEASKGPYGCACDTDACRERCALAPRCDPQAGYSVYSREKAGAAKNAPATAETANPTAPAPDGVEGVWGYRSLAARLVDPRLHVAWNVYTEVHPANADEGRNSALEQKGLKRLPDYGLAHSAFLIGWADGIENLCTLTRLVLEATGLDARVQPQEPAPRPPCIRVENGRPVEEEAAEEGADRPN